MFPIIKFCFCFFSNSFFISVLSHFTVSKRKNQSTPLTLSLEVSSVKNSVSMVASPNFRKTLEHSSGKFFATSLQVTPFLQFPITCSSFPFEMSLELPLSPVYLTCTSKLSSWTHYPALKPFPHS